MKKYMFIVLISLLVSGCSAEYNLHIKNGKISEEINFELEKSKFSASDDELIEESIFSKRALDNVMYDNLYPINDNFSEKYEKIIDDKEKFVDVSLKYTYSEDTYINSKMINQCFEKVNIIETDKEIYIKLAGQYSCLTEENSILKFNLSASDKIVSANGEKQAFNKYTWEINKNNANNVDIEIRMLKQSIYFYYGIRIGVVVAIIAVIVTVLALVVRIRNRETLNDV